MNNTCKSLKLESSEQDDTEEENIFEFSQSSLENIEATMQHEVPMMRVHINQIDKKCK